MNRQVAEAVVSRADGRCEACGEPLSLFEPELVGEIDHAEGRGRSESVETCWVLHRKCHRARHAGFPSAVWWLRHYVKHCRAFGYKDALKRAEDRLAFAEQKSAFGGAA